MARRILSGLLVLLVLLLAVHKAQAQSKPTGKEFKDGWSTWADAKVGDWAEYQVGKEIKRRYEVVKVSGDVITWSEALTMNGKSEDPKEKKPADWWKIKPLSGKVPPNLNPVWSVAEIKVDDLVLKCDVVSWMNGNLSNEVYFCKDVPCGGLVKFMMDGQATIWLANFGDKDNKVGKLKGSDPNAGRAANLPAFYATSGNASVHKQTKGEAVSYYKRAVLEGGSREAKLTQTPCDAEGKSAADAKSEDIVIKAEEWLPAKSKPLARGEKVRVTAGEYACDVYEVVEGSARTKIWLSAEGVVVKSETFENGKLTSSTEVVRMSQR